MSAERQAPFIRRIAVLPEGDKWTIWHGAATSAGEARRRALADTRGTFAVQSAHWPDAVARLAKA